jgi:hypothetical protein
LAPLIRVENLRSAMARQCFFQSLDAEICVHAVGHAPRQHPQSFT